MLPSALARRPTGPALCLLLPGRRARLAEGADCGGEAVEVTAAEGAFAVDGDDGQVGGQPPELPPPGEAAVDGGDVPVGAEDLVRHRLVVVDQGQVDLGVTEVGSGVDHDRA